MAGLKIQDAPLVSILQGSDKLPVSNGSGKAVTANIQQIKDFVFKGIDLNADIYIIVTELPSTDIKTNKIYLIPNAQTSGENIYTEYMYVNGKWETLGEYKADIDLTPYATKEDINKNVIPRISTLENTVGVIDAGLNQLLGI